MNSQPKTMEEWIARMEGRMNVLVTLCATLVATHQLNKTLASTIDAIAKKAEESAKSDNGMVSQCALGKMDANRMLQAAVEVALLIEQNPRQPGERVN